MMAGVERMGVKMGLSASLLLLKSPVFLFISHGGAQTVGEQKKSLCFEMSTPSGGRWDFALTGVSERRRAVKYSPERDS